MWTTPRGDVQLEGRRLGPSHRDDTAGGASPGCRSAGGSEQRRSHGLNSSHRDDAARGAPPGRRSAGGSEQRRGHCPSLSLRHDMQQGWTPPERQTRRRRAAGEHRQSIVHREGVRQRFDKTTVQITFQILIKISRLTTARPSKQLADWISGSRQIAHQSGRGGPGSMAVQPKLHPDEPITADQTLLVLRVHQDPTRPDDTSGLELLPDDVKALTRNNGWEGPWELTTWGKLIKEVIDNPHIPLEDLPEVPREEGTRGMNLYYQTTGLDTWGNLGEPGGTWGRRPKQRAQPSL